MYNVKILFYIFELCAFLLPALPSNIYVRLAILTSYLILHYLKVHTIYSKFKQKYSSHLKDITKCGSNKLDENAPQNKLGLKI